MKNIKIKIKPLKINITPYGFYSFARDYYYSAKAVSTLEPELKNKINYPAYFLYCRSIELSIKAVLLASGNVKEGELKRYKHDFNKLIPSLTKELKRILMMTRDDEKMLIDIDKWYKTDQKRFEYFSTDTLFDSNQLPILPELSVLDSLSIKMIGPQVNKFVVNS